jgi:type IV pilus assembly protein PilE
MEPVMKTKRTQTGVTLIELMVTIAVLAVVASIAIPAYTGYIKTAQKGECLHEVAAIQLALEEFFLENNEYFSGTLSYTSTSLISNSGGYYKNSSSAAERNCVYDVATTGGTAKSGYVLTVSGTNKLAGEGYIKTITK